MPVETNPVYHSPGNSEVISSVFLTGLILDVFNILLVPLIIIVMKRIVIPVFYKKHQLVFAKSIISAL